MSTKKKPPPSPTTEEIVRERERYGLTQEKAGELIYYTLNGWQRLEYGQRAMQPALWELWQIKAARRAEQLAAAEAVRAVEAAAEDAREAELLEHLVGGVVDKTT